MKRTVLLLYVLVIVTMGLTDDLAERMADILSMSKTDVQICINKTSVKLGDLMLLDEMVDDDWQIVDFNNSALKVGCFFTCLCQTQGIMTNARINMDKIKKLRDSKMKGDAEHISASNRVLDTCSDRVKGKTDECEVSLQFILCLIKEAKKYERTVKRNNA